VRESKSSAKAQEKHRARAITTVLFIVMCVSKVKKKKKPGTRAFDAWRKVQCRKEKWPIFSGITL
jgi:hypothetical protein